MSNVLREKLLRLEQLVGQEQDWQTKAIIEALYLQTSILNERLFNIELALRENNSEQKTPP